MVDKADMEKGREGVSAAGGSHEIASEMIDFKGDGVGSGIALPGAATKTMGEQGGQERNSGQTPKKLATGQDTGRTEHFDGAW